MCIEISQHEFNDYFLIVHGNGGENQIAIGTSMGQGGYSPVIAVAMQVDGGAKVLVQKERVETHMLPLEIARILTIWVSMGIPETTKQRKTSKRHIGVITDNFTKYCEGA